jgi:hypothetical protein
MLVNPYQNRVEVCDEVGNVYYQIHGIEVSDFLTRAWFQPRLKGHRDFENLLGGPVPVVTGSWPT